MARVTRNELRATVARLQGRGYPIEIQWAYGRPRIFTEDGSHELSPRLSTGPMAEWLDGFETCIDMMNDET